MNTRQTPTQESQPTTERITVSIPVDLAAYLRQQAQRELRSLSGMLSFAAECYRTEHSDE